MEAEEKRRLPRALMRGTHGMREAGKEYLPQEMAESDKAYEVRLRRSFLFNGFAKTVRDMAGKVFARPIAIGDDMPDDLKAYAENIDLTGRNLDVFSHSVLTDALAEGISYILVDMSAAPVDADGMPRVVTRAEAAGRRPWAVHIRARQVLGWRSEDRNGVETLTQFRFMETVTEEDGPFGESEVKQVRAFIREGDAVRWETHRKNQIGSWVLHDHGAVTIGEIAVCPVYVARTGFMAGTPPLADLAEVNLAHWQSQSDQRNILHVARVPILFGSGIPETSGPLEIGASRMVRVSDANAKLAYVEHNGAAIESGRQDLKDLEFQMQMMGLELLIPQPGGQTATGAAIDQARMNAPLAMMARALQDALEQMFGFMALYAGLDRDTQGGSLTVNTDFGVAMSGAADITALITAAKEQIISRATAIRELKRRGVLSDAIDPDAEVMLALDEQYGTTTQP